jgi:hypothetical protein
MTFSKRLGRSGGADRECSFCDHVTTMRRTDSAAWSFFAQPQMRAVLLVVGNVL